MNDDHSRFKGDYSDSSFWEKVKGSLAAAGREAIEKALILYFVLQDPSTPLSAKAKIVGALGYFIAPIDAVPDFTPLIGYGDDIGILAFVLTTVAPHVKDQHRAQAQEKLQEWFD